MNRFLADLTCRRDGAIRRSGVVRRGARDDAHRAPTPHTSKLDLACDEREQGVIAAAADTRPGVEVGATLPDDDLARVDLLATEPLDAEPLGAGVAAVAAGRRAFLVCHVSPSSSRSLPSRLWCLRH